MPANPQSPSTPKAQQRSPTQLVILASIFAVAVGLRLVHLDADVPSWVTQRSLGLYVDEGYKTLSPRNLREEGATHVVPGDTYPGWMETSPITQWAFYLAFGIGGVRIESARVVSVLAYGSLLLVYLTLFRAHYSFGLLLCGLLMLGFQSVLFFFSRVALFETLILAPLYLLLFCISRLGHSPLLLQALLLGGVSATLVFGVKYSSAVYLAPVIGAWLCTSAWPRGSRWKVVLGAGLLVGSGAGMALLSGATLLDRVAGDVGRVASTLLRNPCVELDAAIVFLGFICATDILSFRRRAFLCDTYRLSLLGLVVLTPVLLALVPYGGGPLRYYVPALPAHVLLTLEWVHLRCWKRPKRGSLSLWVCLPAGVMVLYQLYLGLRAAQWAWRGLAAIQGQLDPVVMTGVGLLTVIAAAIVGWRAPRAGLTWPLRCSAVAVSVWLTVGCALPLLSFFFAPTYHAEEIRRGLAAVLPERTVVGGDWAPLFVLGSSLRALYINDEFNRIEGIRVLPVRHLVLGKSENDEHTLSYLQAQPDLRIVRAERLGWYMGGDVTLYAIEVHNPEVE